MSAEYCRGAAEPHLLGRRRGAHVARVIRRAARERRDVRVRLAGFRLPTVRIGIANGRVNAQVSCAFRPAGLTFWAVVIAVALDGGAHFLVRVTRTVGPAHQPALLAMRALRDGRIGLHTGRFLK